MTAGQRRGRRSERPGSRCATASRKRAAGSGGRAGARRIRGHGDQTRGPADGEARAPLGELAALRGRQKDRREVFGDERLARRERHSAQRGRGHGAFDVAARAPSSGRPSRMSSTAPRQRPRARPAATLRPTSRPKGRCRRRRGRRRRRGGPRRRRGARARRRRLPAPPRSAPSGRPWTGPMISISPSPSARRSWTGPKRVGKGSVASSSTGKDADSNVVAAEATSWPG